MDKNREDMGGVLDADVLVTWLVTQALLCDREEWLEHNIADKHTWNTRAETFRAVAAKIREEGGGWENERKDLLTRLADASWTIEGLRADLQRERDGGWEGMGR